MGWLEKLEASEETTKKFLVAVAWVVLALLVAVIAGVNLDFTIYPAQQGWIEPTTCKEAKARLFYLDDQVKESWRALGADVDPWGKGGPRRDRGSEGRGV